MIKVFEAVHFSQLWFQRPTANFEFVDRITPERTELFYYLFIIAMICKLHSFLLYIILSTFSALHPTPPHPTPPHPNTWHTLQMTPLTVDSTISDWPKLCHSGRPLLPREFTLCCCVELPGEDEDYEALWVEVEVREEPHHPLRCDLVLIVRVYSTWQISTEISLQVTITHVSAFSHGVIASLIILN